MKKINKKNAKQEFYKEFARRLNARMEYLGIDQTRLAKMTGISQASICSYLKGRTIPTAYTLRKLAIGLAMTSSELIDF